MKSQIVKTGKPWEDWSLEVDSEELENLTGYTNIPYEEILMSIHHRINSEWVDLESLLEGISKTYNNIRRKTLLNDTVEENVIAIGNPMFVNCTIHLSPSFNSHYLIQSIKVTTMIDGFIERLYDIVEAIYTYMRLFVVRNIYHLLMDEYDKKAYEAGNLITINPSIVTLDLQPKGFTPIKMKGIVYGGSFHPIEIPQAIRDAVKSLMDMPNDAYQMEVRKYLAARVLPNWDDLEIENLLSVGEINNDGYAARSLIKYIKGSIINN